MSLSIGAGVLAIGVGSVTTVGAQGGTPPYTYALLPSGAGGVLTPQMGGGATYRAPDAVPVDPRAQAAVIQVTDDLGATATVSIVVADAIGLLCDILQRELNLAPGRVYLYQQKINMPKDNGLFIAVGVLRCKPFGNINRPDSSGGGVEAKQAVNMHAQISLDIISRDLSALRRKEEVIMALKSNYSQTQQERNAFHIGSLPPGAQFVNLSEVDGSAIPYRFNITIAMQYQVRKTKAVDYFNEFENVAVETES